MSDEQERKARERAARLRAALDGVVLAPETTSDDAPEPETAARDAEMAANKPPHHG